MEINLNLVLFDGLQEQPDGGAEARIVILRECKDVDSALNSAATDCESLE